MSRDAAPGVEISLELLRSVMDSLSEGVIVASGGGEFLVFNPAAERIGGLGGIRAPLEEWSRAYGVYLPDRATLCPVEDLPLVRAMRGEACDDVELFVRNEARPEGVHVQASSRPLLDGRARVLGGVLVMRDITERRRAEEAAAQSRRLLELFFSQSLDGFFFMMLDEPVRWDSGVDKEPVLEWVFDHQRVTKVNDAMLAQYGTSRESFLGLTPRDFFAHDLDHGKLVWRRFFDAGRLHVETEERRFDGTPIYIDGDYICLYDAEGRITGHFGIQRDVTERHRAAEALRASEEKFAKAFRSSPLRLSISRLADGRLVEVNDTFLRDIGLAREEVVGRTAVELGLWEDPGERERMMETLLREGQVRDFEFRGLVRGRETEITLLSGEVIEVGGEPCLLAVAADVTERRRGEEELRRSREELRALAARLQSIREEERRRIAGEIHDELGQALTGLKIDLAWLAGHVPGRALDLAEWARGVAARVDETIATVRRIATELRPSLLDHLGLVAAVEWQASEFERRTGIPVRLALPPDLPELDDVRATNVFRILQEALTNVARHAEAGEVVVALRVEGSDLELEVKDDGRGLPARDAPAPPSLGLVSMRERAIACGGELSIRTQPRCGTALTVRLPLAAETAAAAAPESPA